MVTIASFKICHFCTNFVSAIEIIQMFIIKKK